MTQITAPIFLEYLRRSRLIDERKLNIARGKMRDEIGPEKMLQLETVAEWLISHEYLTEWQVKQLLKKRYKGFFLRQYKILSHIGTGGMSTVYLAEHSVMQRRVAIKVLPKKKLEKSVYLDRFIREAQIVASLDHPNIVRAYDFDQEDDLHYIVMEHFDARNLQEVVAEDGVVSFETAADYIRQAALALEYSHKAGVIHRDVKPGNVLVNDQGLVKVLDLGLALFDEHRFDGQLPTLQEDNILGTADFLAPEQAINSHTVDARADIYGLGGVLYFCLTGHPPFPTGTIPQRLLAHQHEEPQSIFVDRPEAPDSLVRLCQKMMAKKKEQRQQTALEVVTDMQNWLIDNGFADEADFPPLESLRATTETLGAVPIPTQEQRLKSFNDNKWLTRQQQEHDRQSGSRAGMSGGNSDMLGFVSRKANEQPDGQSPDDSHADGSTVSGMMRPILGDTQAQSSSMATGGSASRIHLLTDGVSSAMMQNPIVNANAISNPSHRHGIVDDDDEQSLGTKLAPTTDENDPVLLALSEMGLAEAPARAPVATSSSTLPSRQTASLQQHTPAQPETNTHPQFSEEWYNIVPVWFWCLFGLFIISTIFLAGILVASVFHGR